MIEIQFDAHEIDRALQQLQGSEYNLKKAIARAITATAPGVREAVIGVLVRDVIVGERFIRRAVKQIREQGNTSRFRVFSKNLFLDDYELSPRERTARMGSPSRNWPGFSYQLRRDGQRFNSLGTLGGKTGTGSHPFMERTGRGPLRAMYRRLNGEVFLVYAPSIQYHACAPEVEEEAREVSMEIFHEQLSRIINQDNSK